MNSAYVSRSKSVSVSVHGLLRTHEAPEITCPNNRLKSRYNVFFRLLNICLLYHIPELLGAAVRDLCTSPNGCAGPGRMNPIWRPVRPLIRFTNYTVRPITKIPPAKSTGPTGFLLRHLSDTTACQAYTYCLCRKLTRPTYDSLHLCGE
jgi:hypothetical protein